MRLSHLPHFQTLATLGVTLGLAFGGCSKQATDPATPAPAPVEPGPSAAASASAEVAPAPADVTTARVADAQAEGPRARVTGRILDVAKRLGIAFTSNVMGELEPCG